MQDYRTLSSVLAGEPQLDSSLDHAISAIAAAPNAASLPELNALFRTALLGLGFNIFGVMRLARHDGLVQVRMLFGEGIDPWLKYYIRRGYAADDCIVRECFRTPHPFFWSEIVARGGLSPMAVRILKEAHQFGLRRAFVAPVHKPDSSVLVVLFAGSALVSQSPAERTASQLLASCYATAGSHLHAIDRPRDRRPYRLTQRQIECLKWSLKGKSSTAIGRILDISPRVVDDHFARACKRLGVRTRAQAVHAASNLGYLDS